MKLNKCIGHCKLCNRIQHLSFHHLIPVTLHKNKWFKKTFTKADMTKRGMMLCRDCHKYIHDTYKSKELGKVLNTIEALKQDEKMAKFIAFIKRKH